MTVAEPVPQKPQHRFNAENARAMQAKGEASRKAKAAALQAALEKANEPQEPKPDTFSSRRLARVRSQLTRIDSLLAEETDPAKIDRLAAASSKLEEQERRLSDRSLPAVRRVAEVKTGGRSGLLSGLPDSP